MRKNADTEGSKSRLKIWNRRKLLNKSEYVEREIKMWDKNENVEHKDENCS